MKATVVASVILDRLFFVFFIIIIAICLKDIQQNLCWLTCFSVWDICPVPYSQFKKNIANPVVSFSSVCVLPGIYHPWDVVQVHLDVVEICLCKFKLCLLFPLYQFWYHCGVSHWWYTMVHPPSFTWQFNSHTFSLNVACNFRKLVGLKVIVRDLFYLKHYFFTLF